MKAKSGTTWMLLLWVMGILISGKALADVQMPRIFSDNMVLQREVPVRVWGKADSGERVRVTFQGQTKNARADRSGNWTLTLDPLKPGGPFDLMIRGKNTITYTNILVGDVWLGSGQSNMEWSVQRSANPEEEIKMANHPLIRIFTVPRRMSSQPLDHLEGGEWLVCTPENIPNFSAVAYYFGRHLQTELEVPIGLINSSWGGTVAETWISKESIATHDDFRGMISQGPDFDLEKIQAEALRKRDQWVESLEKDDLGNQHNWQDPNFDDSGWGTMVLPGLWEQSVLPDLDGVVWFRRVINLTKSQSGQSMILNLGPIDDSDYTYVNGTLVGKTIDKYADSRRYEVPANLLKEGENIIAVRVVDTGGGGGFWADYSQLYYLAGTQRESLTGDWKYAVGVKSAAPPQAASGPNIFPSLLYNGMIKAIVPFSIRGVIWYQGESNAGRHYQYRSLFPLLINDWRKQWNNPEMPFLFVQLANYMQPSRLPADTDWARLREAQTMTLSLPKTGMAVIIDIGEADDIHPRNKQDVGKRLALAALKVSYGKDIVYSGPMYQSMNVDGNTIRINFDHIGGGLTANDKYGYLKGFAIAGEDKVFHWAKARLVGNQVIVYNADVKNPVAVRYAWGNNPDDANLYNAGGLPANPFRTDDW
jgi:sialate O-acetylesterase